METIKEAIMKRHHAIPHHVARGTARAPLALVVVGLLALVAAGCAPISDADPSPARFEAWDPEATPSLLVGAARGEITPDRPMREWGGGHQELTDSVYLPLYVRVVVIDDGRTPVAIISGELCFWTDDVIERARRDLEDRHGLGPAQVLLNATHTHNGPQYRNDAAYKEMLGEVIVDLVDRAMAEARPARLYFARGWSDVAVNRRRVGRDGFVRWGINPYGVIDPEVIVVQAVGADGRPLATIMNYACHPTTIRHEGFGGDFVGWAMADLERRTGAAAVFLQGAGGEVKVRNRNPEIEFGFTFDGGIDRVAKFGAMFSRSVLDALEGPLEEITGPVSARLDTVDLPVMADRIDREGEPPLEGPRRRMARMARRMLDAMDEEGNYHRTRPGEVYVVRIGDRFRLVALNGEMSVGVALRTKAQLAGLPVMVLAYTGPSISYFPTADQLHQLVVEELEQQRRGDRAAHPRGDEQVELAVLDELADHEDVLVVDALALRGRAWRAGLTGSAVGVAALLGFPVLCGRAGPDQRLFDEGVARVLVNGEVDAGGHGIGVVEGDPKAGYGDRAARDAHHEHAVVGHGRVSGADRGSEPVSVLVGRLSAAIGVEVLGITILGGGAHGQHRQQQRGQQHAGATGRPVSPAGAFLSDGHDYCPPTSSRSSCSCSIGMSPDRLMVAVSPPR